MLGKVHFTCRSVPSYRTYLVVILLILVCNHTSFATPVPVTCDPKGGITNFGLEWIADSCVPNDITDSTAIHYTNSSLTCNQGSKQVALFAPYGDTTASPAAIISQALAATSSQGQHYKVFRNTEGTHIVMVHPLYAGLIDSKDMTAYTPGQVATDVFKQGFIQGAPPICKDNPGSINSSGSQCPLNNKTEVSAGSTVNIISGRLSHSQELFSSKGGRQPLAITLYYRSMPFAPSSMGNGWSHSSEQSLQILANGTVAFWSDGAERDYRLINNTYTAPRGDYSTLIKNGNGSYTLTEQNGLRRNFDATGRITTIIDRNGTTTTFTYTNNKLTGVSDPNNRSTTLAYDANGKLSTITDPLGSPYTFTYTNGLLTGVTAPDGGSWSYIYGNGAMLTTKTDPGGNSTSYAYDGNNRVTSAVDPQSKIRSFGFSGSTGAPGKVPDPYPVCSNEGSGYSIITDILQATGNCLVTTMPIIDKNGGNLKYDYEYLSGTVKSITDPYNNITRYTHDNLGNMMSKTEPGIGTTTYTYDTTGNMTSQKDPLGTITSYTYNTFGQLLTTTGPQGNSSNVYDPQGNLTSSTDPAGATTTYEYDNRGNITKITNAKTQINTMTYNNANQMITSTDPAGVVTSYTYDGNGNLLTSTNPNGTTTYTYDTMNRLTKITDPLGNITSSSYDKNGNRTSQTDANGNTTTYKYNYQGQVTEAKDALTGITALSYGASGGSCPSCSDGVDKLTSLADAKQQTTSYQYDLMSRLTNETDPLGKITAYSYDPAGNMVSKTDANGITITYTYDALKRLTKKSYPDTTSVTYSYDTAGRILTAANKDISYTYTYDSAGRLATVADNRGYNLAYDYDILGMRTKTTIQKNTPDEHITSYTYDTANRPGTIASRTGTFTYGYDNQGRRSSTSYPNGTTTTYSYDTLSRLTTIKHAAGATTIAFANYSGFDNIGNRKSKTTSAGSETYRYDPLYRLTQAATPNGNENYSYDQVGNRLTGPGPKDTHYQYNAGNQMTMGKLFGYAYDNNGNQTTKTTANGQDRSWIETWDYENRLIKVEQTKGTEKRTVTFKYDPLGRRIEKQLTTVIKGIQKTATWQYVYDSDNIALEIYTNEAGATEKTWYTHGTGTDEHLALERGGQNYYYHADGLGSITAVTDTTKNVVQSYSYDSFGKPTPGNGFRNTYTYTGREWDKETGLYYYRARYYDPVEGRFIAKDPISFAGGDVNLYGYTVGNPVNKTDPLGLATYMCTRRLNNVPLRFGSLFHQYICTGNSKDGYSCKGLGPTGSMFDSPGKLESDQYKPNKCEKVQDDNSCIESCIQDEFKSGAVPNYSVDLSHGDNCQTYANATVGYCQAKCAGRRK